MTDTQRKAIVDELLEVITANMSPEDVFDEETLKDWAEDNGYVKEESSS